VRKILFISDLHLDDARPEVTDQFIDFLRKDARDAAALYVLGDLFEAWIGDDDPDPGKARIQNALSELTRSGVPCYVMHGNRDFLLGKRFRTRTGCRLINDGVIADINGTRVLLLHGDTMCTDDHSYQRLRRIVRNPIMQWIFRRLSLSRRESLAARIRTGSKAHLDRVAAEIMDVNDAAVGLAFAKAKVDVMIHGHTHRPAIHRIQVGARELTRIVLGDWYTQGSVLEWNENGYELRAIGRKVER
jgi:UDP-2,3-diacylglucosamine hydrolase